jgi:cellobiose-specific phosphotransferase system component IIB
MKSKRGRKLAVLMAVLLTLGIYGLAMPAMAEGEGPDVPSTSEPTATPEPTATSDPTATPEPTATLEPTATQTPSEEPTEPTPTPTPVAPALYNALGDTTSGFTVSADFVKGSGEGARTMHYVFANGHNVVVAQEADGKTYATIVGTEDKVEVDGNTMLVAGSASAEGTIYNYDSVTITVNSGVLDTLIGSNRTPGSIGTSNIIINGGTVGMVVANQGTSDVSKIASANNSGASSYGARGSYKVGTSNITVNGGILGAVAGTYGYTQTDTINMTVTGGTITAQTSPVQSGIIVAGTNGQVGNATLKMTGGKTAGISLMQRTLLTGKATLNIQGGTVGAIYAGSFYNDEEMASQTNSWGTWGVGSVNYGQAAAIDITVGKGVSYSNIYKGFQYLDKAAFATKYPSAGSNTQLAGSETAPLNLSLASEPTGNRGAKEQHTVSAIDASDSYISIQWQASNVTLNASTIGLKVGESRILNATVVPAGAASGLTWSSSDESVATVENGTVKAHKAGSATITAKAGSVTATCDIVVTAIETVVEPPVVTGNTPKTEITMDKELLAEAVFTAEEKALIETGATSSIQLSVAAVDAATLSPQVKHQMQQAAGDKLEIGVFLQIDLTKMVGDKITEVARTNAPIRVTITIPEALRGKAAYSVLRLHDGVVTVLKDLDNDPNTVTFETDAFSDYALAYQEAAATTPTPAPTVKPSASNTPKTGDSLWLPVLLGAMLTLAAGITLWAVRRPKHSK